MINLEDLPEDWHFFSTSVANWRTGVDLEEQIRYHKGAGYDFLIYLVPCKEEDTYDLEDYAPQVPGSFIIARYKRDPDVPADKKPRWLITTHREKRNVVPTDTVSD